MCTTALDDEHVPQCLRPFHACLAVCIESLGSRSGVWNREEPLPVITEV